MDMEPKANSTLMQSYPPQLAQALMRLRGIGAGIVGTIVILLAPIVMAAVAEGIDARRTTAAVGAATEVTTEATRQSLRLEPLELVQAHTLRRSMRNERHAVRRKEEPVDVSTPSEYFVLVAVYLTPLQAKKPNVKKRRTMPLILPKDKDLTLQAQHHSKDTLKKGTTHLRVVKLSNTPRCQMPQESTQHHQVPNPLICTGIRRNNNNKRIHHPQELKPLMVKSNTLLHRGPRGGVTRM